MTNLTDSNAAKTLLSKKLAEYGVNVQSIEVRAYPEETIFIVIVPASDFEAALQASASTDESFRKASFAGFVTVRKSDVDSPPQRKSAVARSKADDLANLLAARSRTSEIQPSLEYIPDASNQLDVILTARNHLVFGRRGAGKTTLMVEAKRRLEEEGHVAIWINVQTHRHSPPEVLFLWIIASFIERLQIFFGERMPRVLAELSELQAAVDSFLAKSEVSTAEISRLVPRAQRIARNFTRASDRRLYFFLDDLHYLPRASQPQLLDLLHGVTRDIDGWIKVACIKHLSRWFEHGTATGLQTGHDADHIELDLSLESPTEAKLFLDRVLNVYARHVGLSSAKTVFSSEALNRLVLASGAVPRDYLVLAASAIRSSKRRQNVRQAGVQDVNRAAGEQSKVKIAELEDDAAANTDGGARAIVNALNRVRAFCLDDKRYTFFKVDFRDKEQHQQQYGLIQSLLDVRIIHLIASSLSDKREAGRRAEVFMLDLSQFSGQRLKKRLHVLDYVESHLVLKETSSTVADRRGDTPSKLQELLRGGPTIELVQIPVV